MNAPLGVMSYTGISQVERGSFVLTQGKLPSVATLEILPQDPSLIQLDGTLIISFGIDGKGVEIPFYDCRVDKASFDYGSDGMVWRLSIFDRRWKWRFSGPYGPVSGWYNQRFGSIQPCPTPSDQMGTYQLGSLNLDSLLSPQDLAAMLLDIMGETNYDVSALPNNSLPEVVWEADYPADVLEDLCGKLGCRIVLNLNNTVSIVQVGIGNQLPNQNIERISTVVDPPEIPDSIAVVGGRTRYQADFLLIPVGLDLDGAIRDIWDLSYAPIQFLNGAVPDGANLGGWGFCVPDAEVGFQEIDGWEIDLVIPPETPQNIQNAWQIGGLSPYQNPRYLARQTVFRWYRICMELSADNSGAGPLVPGWGVPYGTAPNQPQPLPDPKKKQAPPGAVAGGKTQWGTRLRALWQILPIEDKRIQGWYDATNNFTPYDAVVFGKYASYSWETLNSQELVAPLWDVFFNAQQPIPVGVPYAIDRERGLVIFEEPVYQLDDSTATLLPAVLYLRCAFGVRAFDTQAPDRFYLERDLSDMKGGKANGAGPRVLKREEIIRCVVPQYDPNFNVLSLFTNEQECVREANYAIDNALLEYQQLNPQDVTYSGIVPIGCDGAVTQVAWSAGPEGATTRVARNTEIHFAVPTFRERVLMGSLARTTDATRTLQQQLRKQ